MSKSFFTIILFCACTFVCAQTRTILNPILRGFNPDPDIIRVGEDYYIATTTFEWWPGVNIYHSKDLEHWKLVARPLVEKHIDLEGVPNSGGNYIPSLLFNEHDSLFYLVYSNVLGRQWPLKANRSYVTTAKSITGSWSDPVYLNSVGFDPAFFFDDDGRAYLINMVLDYNGWPQMIGFMLQEYDTEARKLIGKPQMIFDLREMGESLAATYPEGPHIYQRNGYYYLLFAAHGTYWPHKSWMARSKSLFGPYELAPNNPILTSEGSAPSTLQKAGQGSLVETQHGDWYLAHHVSRPILPDSVSPLGRETCLQEVVWTKDGWLELKNGGKFPADQFMVRGISEDKSFKRPTTRWDFNTNQIPPTFQSLRSPMDESWIKADSNKGILKMRGRQTITSLFEQSMVATRWTSLNFAAETALSFSPEHFLQTAGLTLFYDTEDFIYLYITQNKAGKRELRIMEWEHKKGYNGHWDYITTLPGDGKVYLRAEVMDSLAQFQYKLENTDWESIGPNINIGHLSDEGHEEDKNGFTGAFVGLAVQDRLFESKWAQFDYFYYDNKK